MLLEQMEEHYGLLLFQRCTVPAEKPDTDKSQELRRSVRETIASKIVLSTWVVPVVDKPLADCSFAEVAEVAPVAGRFLAKLAKEGAPGTLVKEVFPNEDALQEFWRQAQNSLDTSPRISPYSSYGVRVVSQTLDPATHDLPKAQPQAHPSAVLQPAVAGIAQADPG